jgi:iron complex outermembrane receptor protein
VSAPQPSGPGFIPSSVETADVLPNHNQFSQEFRAESNYGTAAVDRRPVLLSESIQIDSISFDSLARAIRRTRTTRPSSRNAKSWAAFGSLNYTVSDKLKLRGGVRYTRDKKDFLRQARGTTTAGPFSIDNTSHNVSWDLSGTYALTRHQPVRPRRHRLSRAFDAGPPERPGDKPSFAGAESALSSKPVSSKTCSTSARACRPACSSTASRTSS